MSDFSYQKNIERFYSYSTPNRHDNPSFNFLKNIDDNQNPQNNSFISVLFSKLKHQSSRFLDGFYPIENNNNRWMSGTGKVLLDVSSNAKFFFIKGYFPDNFHPENKLEVSVYFDETLIETITISKIDDYTKVISIDKFLVNNSVSAILVKIVAHCTIIPAKRVAKSSDNRELSILIESLGFVESENLKAEIDQNYKKMILIDQPLVPYFKGRCPVCGSEEKFTLDNIGMVRESFRCNNCGSSNRIKQLARGLINYFKNCGFTSDNVKELSTELNGKEASIYDTDSNYFVAQLLRKFKGYVTSDYLENVEPGTKLSDNHFCQDLSNLTFDDNSFDIVLSSDVFEHIRLYKKAISEIFRVLKPGGVFLFNVPFKSDLDEHETYVKVLDPNDPSKDIDVKSRVYHGDTLTNEGALLYRIYGKQLFKEFEDAGFYIKYERSTIPDFGIFDCDLFTAHKPSFKSNLHNSGINQLNESNILINQKEYFDCKLLNIELSSICNLRCKWCILDHTKPAEFLSLNELKNIMQQIQDELLPSLERIELHNGGETLLHPQIDNVLMIIGQAKKNFNKPIFISLLTNGTKLKDSTLNILTSEDVVDEIRISVDGGTRENFEEIRKNAKWDKVALNVKRLKSAIQENKSNIKLGIICMVPPNKPANTNWMEEEFKEVLSLADTLEIRHPHSWEGSLPESSGLQSNAKRKHANRICKFLKNDMVVLASGKVTVCCADLNGRGIIGNAESNSLMEIFYGAERQGIISLWKEGRFDEIPLCSTCEGYYDLEPAIESISKNQILNTHNSKNNKTKLDDQIKQTLELLNLKLNENSLFEIEIILNKTKSTLLSDNSIRDFKKTIEEKRRKLKESRNWSAKISAQKLFEAERNIEGNNLDKSENLLLEILNFEPSHIEASNNLAVVYILKEKYEKALDTILFILSNDNENEIAIGNLEYLKSIIDITEIFKNDYWLKNQVQKLDKPIFVESPSIKINQFKSSDDFKSYTNKMSNEFIERFNYEKKLLVGDDAFTFRGYCIGCESNVDFIVDYNYAYEENGVKTPNWRESLLCPNCNLNNRTRAALSLVSDHIKPQNSSKIFITEQTTPLYQHVKSLYPNTVGSEYLGSTVENGSLDKNGIRNEDLTNLTFESNEFDLVLSFEVFEHIPDFKRAFSEVLRVLKSGGKLLFTVPFNRNSETNLVRAVIQDNQVHHICTPEYHGDPINESEGCLCFYHFGWEVLEQLKSSGFEEAYCCTFYSTEAGHIGDEQFFIIAEKTNNISEKPKATLKNDMQNILKPEITMLA